MSGNQFPSGEWVGFYTYAGRSRKYLMDLILEFKNGVMAGEGADGIGLYVISGNYSVQNGECAWVKQYVGRHAVQYKGFREGKGIWGNWTILNAKGGFHIWPLSEGAPLVAVEETDEQEKPRLATLKSLLIRAEMDDGSVSNGISVGQTVFQLRFSSVRLASAQLHEEKEFH